MNLRSLEGYLKMPEGFPLAKVRVPLTLRDEVAAPFLPREDRSLLVTRTRTRHATVAFAAAQTSKSGAKRPRESDDGQGRLFDEGAERKTDPVEDLLLAEETAPDRGSSSCAGSEGALPRSRSPRNLDADLGFPEWDV